MFCIHRFESRLIPRESYLKIGWDLLVLAAAFTAAIVIPYRMVAGVVAFDGLYGFITIVFSMDILVHFNTQVMTGLKNLDHRRLVARFYLSSWFVPDVLAALPLASFAWFIAPGDISGMLFFKGLFILHLIKLLKVPFMIKVLKDRVNVPPALTRILVFLFWFAILAHFMSLGWLAIGAGEQQRTFSDQYLRALYWCITTITTIGYGDYGPSHDSNLQILYTIAAQIMGVGMFSYIIGNMATLIVNLDSARTQFQTRVEEIRNCMRIQRIPAPIQERVKEYYHYLWNTRQGLSNDKFMMELPQSLRMEIALHLNRSILEKVELFKDADDVFIRAVIEKLDPMVFLPGDWIIRQGEFGSCMYFLSRGEVEISANGVPIAKLPEGSAFGETAILRGERRNASVQTLAYCDVYRLSKADFDMLRGEFPEFDTKVRAIVDARVKATCDDASCKH